MRLWRVLTTGPQSAIEWAAKPVDKPNLTPEEPDAQEVAATNGHGEVEVLDSSLPRRCEGTNRRGERCSAYSLRGETLCRIHSRLAEGAPIFGNLTNTEAGERSAEVRRGRAEIRRMLVPPGSRGPKAVLRAAVVREQARLAERLVRESLDESNGVKGAILGLKLIETVDPAVSVSASFDIPTSMDDLAAMDDATKRAWALAGT